MRIPVRQVFQAALAALATVTLGAGAASANPFFITPTTNAATLVSAIAGSIPGISVTSGSEVLTGVAGQSGTFTGGAGIIPFDNGILLTSGQAVDAAGPNSSPFFSTDNNGNGDADLDVVAGNSTFDAATLSFTFTPSSAGTISFQFVFGSDEYPELLSTIFNDAFAFFLNGENIALVNGDPVTINTVNNVDNAAYFFDNTVGALNTEYDGLVGVNILFPVFATGNVIANAVNTIKIAIGDAEDYSIDSGVFIAGGTFDPEQTAPIPEPASLTLLGTGLLLAGRSLRRRQAQR